jgi:hypothetical protein
MITVTAGQYGRITSESGRTGRRFRGFCHGPQPDSRAVKRRSGRPFAYHHEHFMLTRGQADYLD